MPYNRLERKLASLLESAPGLHALAKAAYQRANYLLHGGRRERMRLHPQVAIDRLAGGAAGVECFFGYFGTSPWSRDGGQYLFHSVSAGEAMASLCLRDAGAAGTRVLGETRAWNLQQGSMAQWLSADGGEAVVFNDVADRRLVCRILAAGGRERVLPWPVQALHPRGHEALSINYRRLARLRPEYGYDTDVDNFAPDQPPDRDGIWRVDMRTAGATLVVSLQQLAESRPRPEMTVSEHKVNHAVYSPSGRRFVFMHRWLGPHGKFSRLYCCDDGGTAPRLLLDHRMVSHYAWRDDDTLLAWARAPDAGDRYYLIHVDSGTRRTFGAGTLDRYGDGHPSYSPDGNWLVTDSYPDRKRMRRLLLCRADNAEVTEIGAFHSPWRYDGPARCDLHPRWSPDGRRISIDSSHEGTRWSYAVDVSRLVGSA